MARHSDWLSLVELRGLVISEPVLNHAFPDGPNAVPWGTQNWLRRHYETWQVTQGKADLDARKLGARAWIDFLLETALGLNEGWCKNHEVPDRFRVQLPEYEQTLRPSRVLLKVGQPVLLVTICNPDQQLDRPELEAGRWKASPATKMDRLLRETGVPLGLVTNGASFRLVHARQGLNTGSITWTANVLMEEKAALDAFYTLLGRRCLFDPKDEDLADLCKQSVDRQKDVADQLGQQVRDGLERLLWAWDAADHDTNGKLLASKTEGQIYEMGLVVMMRLIFLLYAEERALLPHGQVLYDRGYGLTHLWHRLQQQRRLDPEGLAHCHDAWGRFLATCRLLHGGSRHPDLPLLAYGGNLFDPARFPQLEDPDCKVSNQVVYEVLHRLLFAKQTKGGEPQRVGYWALSVEQIGYIYEGLLDHRCARAGDQPMVKLVGAGEEALPLADLEAAANGWVPGLSDDAPPPPETLVGVIANHLHKKPKDKDLEQVRARLLTPATMPDLKDLAALPPPLAQRVQPFASVVQCDEVVCPHRRYLTTGTSRRESGSHYTPQFLTERVVRTTLEPQVFRCEDGKPGKYLEPRQVKSPKELLDLKVCDIAMGSGAFLVQAVRYLADRLVEAWDRAFADAHASNPRAVLSMPFAEPSADEKPLRDRDIDPDNRDEMVLWARRFVVERCIYGVDINPLAVEMAKLSLWLTTLSKNRAFTFLDHALRCGDSLLGVNQRQLSTWSLDGKGTGARFLQFLLGRELDKAAQLRTQLGSIQVIEADDAQKKARLLVQADAMTKDLRVAADLLVAPFVSKLSPPEKASLSTSLQSRVSVTMEKGLPEGLLEEHARLLHGRQPFHWFIEFPEVFGADKGGFDAIVGNPPFIGGQFIRRQLGDEYLPWLRTRWSHSHGTADFACFFFLKAFENLRSKGSFGLISTNTISQGDTRESGLDELVKHGGAIFAAVPRMPWPGEASVNVSLVSLHRGPWAGTLRLEEKVVPRITTSLDSSVEGNPFKLLANDGLSFQGSIVLGLGFTMSPEEAADWIAKDPRNKEVLFPYLNGEDLNTSPTQAPSRWVINFQDWPLEKAKEWPELLAVVEEKVKPQRDGISTTEATSQDAKEHWWRFLRPRMELYRTIAPLKRVLARSRVSNTHSVHFMDPRLVFSEATVVFAAQEGSFFAAMQSAFHDHWARQWSSSMRTDVRYAPSDCFDTFPFPLLPQDTQARLDALGEAYHAHRQRVMQKNNEGLTKTYNRFHNPTCQDPDIIRLRELQVEMDNAVRDAYGWSVFDLGHGWVETKSTAEKKHRKTGRTETVEVSDWRYAVSPEAKEELLRRLLALNHQRHEEEVQAGLFDTKKSSKGKKPKEAPVELAAKKTPMLF